MEDRSSVLKRQRKAPEKLRDDESNTKQEPIGALIIGQKIDWETPFVEIQSDQRALDLLLESDHPLSQRINLKELCFETKYKIPSIDLVSRLPPKNVTKEELCRFYRSEGGKGKILAPARLFDEPGCESEESWICSDGNFELTDPDHVLMLCDLKIENQRTGRQVSLVVYPSSPPSPPGAVIC